MAPAETARLMVARLEGCPDGRVFAAVLDELVDQHGILSEVEMDVAGQEVGRNKALVPDHIAFGIQHLVGGLEPAVVARDPAPVKLVSSIKLAAGRENAVLQGQDLPIAEAVDFAIHLDINRDHACHLVGGAGGAQ